MSELTSIQTLVGIVISTSVLCFCSMGWDKLSARKGWRRTPERRLLWWAALGGAIGGIAAQRLFRHKTAKRPFVTWLYLWCGLNLIFFGVLAILV
ncbi:MAG: DUF1294 domain-containing protein [Roseovarius sp.]